MVEIRPVIKADRRRRRSEDTRTALEYQLDCVRSEAALEALVLADDAGLPLAMSGDTQICVELAALAPIAAHQQHVPRGASFDSGFVHLRVLRFDGVVLYLASCSDSVADVWSARIEAWLAKAQHGVTRILAA
jgi:hypothetical protein